MVAATTCQTWQGFQTSTLLGLRFSLPTLLFGLHVYLAHKSSLPMYTLYGNQFERLIPFEFSTCKGTYLVWSSLLKSFSFSFYKQISKAINTFIQFYTYTKYWFDIVNI